MSCDAIGPLLLDESSARAPEAQAHLAGCPRCQALLRAHQAAESLRALPFELPSRTREVPVRSLWRRRLLWRGTFAALLAGVAVAAIVSTPEPRLAPSSEVAGTPSLAVRNPPTAAETRDALRTLILEVDSYTQQDVTTQDPALAAFGALPTLLTPEAKH